MVQAERQGPSMTTRSPELRNATRLLKVGPDLPTRRHRKFSLSPKQTKPSAPPSQRQAKPHLTAWIPSVPLPQQAFYVVIVYRRSNLSIKILPDVSDHSGLAFGELVSLRSKGTSVAFDVGCLRDRCPLLRLRRQESCKFRRRCTLWLCAQLAQARLHFSGLEALVDDRVELGHDACGSAGRRENAIPLGCHESIETTLAHRLASPGTVRCGYRSSRRWL